MSYKYKTISGSSEATLLYRNKNFANKPFIASILLCNTHATDSVSVDLYVVTTDVPPKDTDYYIESEEDLELYGNPPDESGDVTDRTITETSYYIIKGLVIPVNASLLLEKEDIMLKRADYELRIKLSAGDSDVDVSIDLTNNEYTY